MSGEEGGWEVGRGVGVGVVWGGVLSISCKKWKSNKSEPFVVCLVVHDG